jgi:hypothetical protein
MTENTTNNSWVPVPVEPFTTAYELNRAGQVRSTKTKKVLAPGRPNSSSPFVILASKEVEGGRKPFTVSKLVKLAFADKPARPEVIWGDTGSMLSELNFLRTERGEAPIKKWSKSKAELEKRLRKMLEV